MVRECRYFSRKKIISIKSEKMFKKTSASLLFLYFQMKITILMRILSSLAYGPDNRALFGTAKPACVFRNSCDIKSLVGVT